jgi:hypothetical protein
VAPGEFSDNWSRIPWHFRLAILLVAPLYGGYHYLTASRESIGRKLKSEDLVSSEEVIGGEIAPEFDEAIIASRDAKLVAALESVVTSVSPPNTVGIVYGAAHMKAVTAILMGKYHYRVEGSEWLAVFDYEAD